MTKKMPFEGVNILDLTWMGVGPFSINYLIYYGATAIKVESASRPDPLRHATPYKDGIPGLERSYYFAYTHPVESYNISLNLNHAKGIDLAKRLDYLRLAERKCKQGDSTLRAPRVYWYDSC